MVINASHSPAFAKVYTSKMPTTVADLLYDRVSLFYEARGVPAKAVLTDNGREFPGRPEHHPYQLLLALHDVEHPTTKIRSPRTNGLVERMQRTLFDEIQADLDVFVTFSNLERSHQDYRPRAARQRRHCVLHWDEGSCHRSLRRRVKAPSPR